MAPGRVRADEDQQIGLIEILVAAGDCVGAKGAAMAGDRGRHAEPRVGIDIRRADKALHQLVGDVIILGEELAGQIERDRVGAISRHDVLHAMGDMIERIAPGDALEHALAADHRIEQAAFQPDSLTERGALGAQPAEIGGMVRIASDRRTAHAVRRRQHAAADAAIGTGRLGGTKRGIDRRHIKLPCHAGSIKPPWKNARARDQTSCRSGSPPPCRDCGSARDTRAHRRYRRSAPRR
ncbi:hypothetical protein ABIG07_005134 [Bradyrhizobium ottawaense]|uniref:Uncharacterized protein n=1 Tax=Bradyrhizobium ottawaense TaxID=931866 RepID=A0ABV4FX54_9BRAD